MDRHAADELIRTALQRDDPAACELLWDRYAGDLLAFLQATLGSRHDAEDVVQAVFVRIVRKRRHLAAARCLDAYVYQIARHEAASYRRQNRHKRPAQPDDQPWLIATEPDRPSGGLAEELQQALGQLPPAQREVIVLKVYRDRTFQQIATMLGLSLNTVASRYRYGLEKLRTLLKEDEP